MRLLVTRPDEDAGPLMAALEALGHRAFHMPLLSVRHLPGVALPKRPWQALLVTSANGVRALAAHAEAARLRDVAVFAVGNASAEAARAAGFAHVHAAGGDVGLLAASVRDALSPQNGPLLHVAGSVLAGDLKGMLEVDGFAVERAVLYAADVATVLPREGRELIAAGGIDGVMFFSPRTAMTFVTLVRAAGLEAATGVLDAYCLSQAVAQALAPLTFGRVLVSGEPSQDGILKLTRSA